MPLYEIERGAATADYIHYCEHELSVLSGKGVVTRRNSEIPLGEIGVAYIPPAKYYQFVNRGDEV